MENKKYYFVRKVPSDGFCIYKYFGFDEDGFDKECIHNHVWLGGHKDFQSFNDELKNTIIDAFDTIMTAEDGYTNTNVINNYTRLVKANGKNFSSNEISQIVNCAKQWYNDDRREYECVCKVLEILYGKHFVCKVLRGCCQADWIHCICPDDYDTRYLEACYFGTGTQLQISDNKLDSIDDFDSNDNYYDYTYEHTPDGIKQYVAGIIGCSVDEIKLYVPDEKHIIVTYSYKEEI